MCDVMSSVYMDVEYKVMMHQEFLTGNVEMVVLRKYRDPKTGLRVVDTWDGHAWLRKAEGERAGLLVLGEPPDTLA